MIYASGQSCAMRLAARDVTGLCEVTYVIWPAVVPNVMCSPPKAGLTTDISAVAECTA